jgi:hypothetical protein
MTNLAFPSKEFPGQPDITLQIPDDWEPIHPAGAVMAARLAADEGSAFVPNVVVRVDPRPADFELADAVAELRSFVAGRPEGTSSEPVRVELNGRMLVGCDLAWVDDRIGTVLQAHLFESLRFEGPASGPFIQLVQVTGSVGGARARQDYPTIEAILRSLTVEA